MTEPLPLLVRAAGHGDRVAIVDGEGERAYAELLAASEAVAGALLAAAGGPDGPAGDLGEARVAFLAPPGFAYGAAQWGIWRAGGIALPLCTFHPPRELAYALDDAGVTLALAHPALEATLGPLAGERGLRLVTTREALAGAGGPGVGDSGGRAAASGGDGGGSEGAGGESGARGQRTGPRRLPSRIEESRGAMILYTSGTTSRPRGALHTHRGLRAQIESLVEAWGWTPGDRILHVLPLHHTHGIVNAFLCPMWAGATCEMLPSFDAEAVWERFAAGARGALPPITLFMAVPTIYLKLIEAWEEAPEGRRRAWSEGARSLRLMVSGSAALPARTFRRWREITGHDLLERYGMTEIGMALSNPLDGERRPGTVGLPLPGVRLRLVGEAEEVLAEAAGPALLREGAAGGPAAAGDPAAARDADPGAGPPGGEPPPAAPPSDAGPGEIRARGPGVFREYWDRPEATREAFRDGWFRTGDVAAIEDGYWRILGRSSVDIIKTGGYKVSALEIEEVLRAHAGVADCAVVGAPDPEWGERVCAAVVPAGSPEGRAGGAEDRAARAGDRAGRAEDRAGSGGAGRADDLAAAVDRWARERLAAYKVPRRWRLVEALPRNALGKVIKPEVKAMFADPPAEDEVTGGRKAPLPGGDPEPPAERR